MCSKIYCKFKFKNARNVSLYKYTCKAVNYWLIWFVLLWIINKLYIITGMLFSWILPSTHFYSNCHVKYVLVKAEKYRNFDQQWTFLTIPRYCLLYPFMRYVVIEWTDIFTEFSIDHTDWDLYFKVSIIICII